MSALPDELWRRILELGVTRSGLGHRDLCCISISCRLLRRLSDDDALWSALLFTDFHQDNPVASASHTPSNSSSKSLYKIRFERERERKLAAHRRAVLRVESQIGEHSRKLQEIELRLNEETGKLKATVAELSNLQKVRRASVALNVWQPEVVRGRQKHLVEQCVVPIDFRINALEMELKLCRQLIAGLDKAHRYEKRRLDEAKEHLVSIEYHPLRSGDLVNSRVGEYNIKRKKLKRFINGHEEMS